MQLIIKNLGCKRIGGSEFGAAHPEEEQDMQTQKREMKLKELELEMKPLRYQTRGRAGQ